VQDRRRALRLRLPLFGPLPSSTGGAQLELHACLKENSWTSLISEDDNAKFDEDRDTKPGVLADGTYSSDIAFSTSKQAIVACANPCGRVAPDRDLEDHPVSSRCLFRLIAR